VRQLEVAAGNDRLLVAVDDPVRVLLVEHVVDDRVHDQADRLPEVEEATDLLHREQLVRRRDIGEDHGRRGVIREQRLSVQVHARVVVHVHDAGRGVDRLGDLVRVLYRGQAGPEVEELGDALADHVPDGAAKGGAVEARAVAVVAHRLDRRGGHRAIDGEVVLAAEDRVVHPRDARPRGVDLRRNMIGVHLCPGHIEVAHSTAPVQTCA
jgi:hypothetical protein